MFNITLVSAFFTNANSYRSTEKYIELGEKLLNIELPKIIFLEQPIYDSYYKNTEFANTKFIIIDRYKDNYLYQYLSDITDFNVLTDRPEKDTLEYMITMCGKTEWIRKAIEINCFNTEQFIWIDFGIYHMINDNDLFKEYMYLLNEKKYDNVRIASCWNPQGSDHPDIYKIITWYFAGSIFGGNKEKLFHFSHLMKEKCLSIIQEKKSLMWEINIWYLIYKDNPELFSSYPCDHSIYILSQY